MRSTYASLFTRYQDTTVLERCYQYARWTLPQLMAKYKQDSGTHIHVTRDYQERGALLVNNLSSKLTALLFPTRPFFRIAPSEQLKQRAKEQGVKDVDLASGFSKMEAESAARLFLNGSYEQLTLALKYLIVCGSVLIYRDTVGGKVTTYGPASFGVKRDGRGGMLDCVLKESIDFYSLAADVQAAIRAKHSGKFTDEDAQDNSLDLYTRAKRSGVTGAYTYTVSQEIEGITVGTPGSYPEHLCPWIAPTWSIIHGEHYGRGLVEDYAGGFAKLSDLSHAYTLYSIAASKVVNLVAPGSGSDADDLQAAETGEYVAGTPDTVKSYEAGDARKMEQIRMDLSELFQSLAKSFMYSGTTRNAERVTAFELKQDAMEAENTLGGVYSSLSSTTQGPLAHLLLTEVNPGMLEGIITKDIKLSVITGIPALGRQADVQNLVSVAQDAGAIIPTLQQLSSRIDPNRILDIILAGQSVDPSTVYKDADQIAEEEKAQAQAAQGQAQIQASTTMADQASQLQALQG